MACFAKTIRNNKKNFFALKIVLQNTNLTYFIRLFIIVIIILYNYFIIEFVNFDKFVTKFKIIVSKNVFDINNNCNCFFCSFVKFLSWRKSNKFSHNFLLLFFITSKFIFFVIFWVFLLFFSIRLEIYNISILFYKFIHFLHWFY